MRNAFSTDYKVVLGAATPQTALVNSTDYPASGSYVDISGYEWVNVVVQLGGIADAVVFTLKQTDGVSGATLDTIDTVNCKKTIATTDDGQVINFYLESNQTAADHHFITCQVTGVSGNNYAGIVYYLGGARHKTVTQTAAVMPSDNQLIKAG